MRDESLSVIRRYQRRTRTYDPLDPAVNRARQELERALIRWLRVARPGSPENLSVLEIGCGTGGNLLQLLRLGFRPENIVGNELQDSLVADARHRLPAATRIIAGDALDVSLPANSFDVVFQSLVFSSLLDDGFQAALADRMWSLAKPGGGVLWYDFIYDNPSNPDVRGVPIRRVRQLFPQASLRQWRITLAPPVSRVVTRIHPGLYAWLNCLRFLRTHVLCWAEKTRP